MLPSRPLSLAEARARLAHLQATGNAANPINETETVGDRLAQYISELEDDAGLARSGLRYTPPIQPAPTWLDTPFGTFVLAAVVVIAAVAVVMVMAGVAHK